MKISLSDQSLRLQLSTPVADALRRGDARSLSTVAGELHGYAIAQSRLIGKMRLGEMQDTGRLALRRLQKLELITAVEAKILTVCLTQPTISTDLADYLPSILEAHSRITANRLSSPVAIMVSGIAVDAGRREAAAQPKESTSKKRTGARKKMNKRAIMAWIGDVVGATVGGGAAGAAAAPSGPGAVAAAAVVGTIAASAVSGAILA